MTSAARRIGPAALRDGRAERHTMDMKEQAENLGLTEEEYRDMIALFFESGGSDLRKLETAVAAGDAAQAHAASHSLKGSAGSLALTKIYEQACSIDDKLRLEQLDGVAEMVADLRTAYDSLAAALGWKR